jgi:hypothetical protein
MSDQRPSNSAERQRRYRQRQRRGSRVFNIELVDADIEKLVDSGLLDERQSFDSLCIARAVERLVEGLGETYE